MLPLPVLLLLKVVSSIKSKFDSNVRVCASKREGAKSGMSTRAQVVLPRVLMQ